MNRKSLILAIAIMAYAQSAAGREEAMLRTACYPELNYFALEAVDVGLTAYDGSEDENKSYSGGNRSISEEARQHFDVLKDKLRNQYKLYTYTRTQEQFTDICELPNGTLRTEMTITSRVNIPCTKGAEAPQVKMWFNDRLLVKGSFNACYHVMPVKIEYKENKIFTWIESAEHQRFIQLWFKPRLNKNALAMKLGEKVELKPNEAYGAIGNGHAAVGRKISLPLTDKDFNILEGIRMPDRFLLEISGVELSFPETEKEKRELYNRFYPEIERRGGVHLTPEERFYLHN